MGDRLLGVRTDTYDLDTRLQAALAEHLHHGPPGYNNYSVRLSDPSEGTTTPLRKLYRAATMQLASRSRRRILQALLRHLSAWALAAEADQAGPVEIGAVAAVGHGRAILLPHSQSSHAPGLERRLARAGLSLVDAPVAHLDATTGELVVGEPALTIDWAPLEGLLEGDRRPSSEGHPVEPGRYPVACWALPRPSRHGLSPEPPSAAEAVLEIAGRSRPPASLEGSRTLAALAAAVADARILRAPDGASELADAVIAASAQ